MFGAGRRNAERLQAHGRRVPAVILEVTFGKPVPAPAGHRAGPKTLSKELRLRVQIPGQPPFDVVIDDHSHHHFPLSLDTRLDVLVDPDDQRRVAIPDDVIFTIPGGAQYAGPRAADRAALLAKVAGLLQTRLAAAERTTGYAPAASFGYTPTTRSGDTPTPGPGYGSGPAFGLGPTSPVSFGDVPATTEASAPGQDAAQPLTQSF